MALTKGRTHQPSVQRDAIVDLALSGHSPRALAGQFGMTEWTIKRWVARAHRRQQRPYWKQMSGALPGSKTRQGDN